MNLKYILGVLATLPLLPLLYLQGKRLKKNFPKLPEAKGPSGSTAQKHPKKIRLLTIGESAMACVGAATHAEAFTGTLATQLATFLKTNIQWKVYAKTGFTMQKTHQETLPLIEEDQADIIVIGLGANDAFELNSPQHWREQTTILIKKIRLKFPKTPIFFNNMPPIKEFPAFTKVMKFSIGNLVEIFGQELQAIVQQHENVFYNAEIITLQEWGKRYNRDVSDNTIYFSDGVHPSQMTYQIWAEDMAQFIKDRLRM